MWLLILKLDCLLIFVHISQSCNILGPFFIFIYSKFSVMGIIFLKLRNVWKII